MASSVKSVAGLFKIIRAGASGTKKAHGAMLAAFEEVKNGKSLALAKRC